MALKVTEEQIKAAYSGAKLADSYVENRFVGEAFQLLHDRQVAAVQRQIVSTQPSRILEVAPGPGRVTRDLRFDGEWTCVEFNAGMIDVGRAACSKTISWIEGDAFELSREVALATPVDLVYSFRFIRHFEKPDRTRLYQQIHRVLAHGGTLVFDAVNAVVSRPIREASPGDYTVYDELYVSEEALAQELREQGFHNIKFEPVQRNFALQYRVQCLVGPRSRYLSRALVEILERTSRSPSLEWIVTCTKP